MQSLINVLTEMLNAIDLSGGIRQRRARLLLHTPDVVGELHPRFRGLGRPGDRGRRSRVRRGRERNVTLAGEQRGRRVKPDPAGSRDVHLGPGVQVGEVLRRAARPIQTRLIRGELDQVAGDEPSRQPAVPQRVHQQPGRVPAGADLPGERLVRCLDAGFHPGGIADIAKDGGVQGSEKLNRRLLICRRRPRASDPLIKDRATCRGWDIQIRLQISGELVGIAETGNSRAYSSMKKSNGLITRMSATRPTVISSSLALPGKTTRAT